jgi:hypothetical protein
MQAFPDRKYVSVACVFGTEINDHSVFTKQASSEGNVKNGAEKSSPPLQG